MGADITLESLWDKKAKELELDKKRDEYLASSNDEEKRKAWIEADDKVREGCYFRDSYNQSNLAWLYKLSYWQEAQMMESADDDERSGLPIERAKVWLETLKAKDARTVVEEALTNAKCGDKPDLALTTSETAEQVIEFFDKKRTAFIALLEKSIELNEPLSWSV